MAHPKITSKFGGKVWHLEDSGLKLVAAQALAQHLRKTEEKLARVTKAKDGYRVWWGSK